MKDDLGSIISSTTSTSCDSPVKPLSMDTLLEAKRLLKGGYQPVPAVLDMREHRWKPEYDVESAGFDYISED